MWKGYRGTPLLLDHNLPASLKRQAMAAEENKERKVTPTAPSQTSKKSKAPKGNNADGGEEHNYDPVGMAGQKAGIVNDNEQQKGRGESEKDK